MAFDGSVNIDSSIDGSGFSDGLGKLGNIAKSTLGGVVTAIGAASAAIAGLAAAAIKTGSEFESQMSRVKAISGATASEFDALTKQAIQLGATTVFSATEAAQGMENLASAGFSTNEIMSAMPGMLDLAASSGEGLAASADIAASTLRGFGLAADQAGHVADVLAKNAAATNAAVADTGEAMKYVAPVAQNAGWSLESVTAAIGEMANAGIKGSQAGTVLRGALTSLMNPSKNQAEAMQAIGFSAYDAAGHMKTLSQMISDLQSGTASLTEQQRNQYIATIFGTEALSGMQVLIQQGAGSLDDLTQSLVNSDGAAADMAATMNDNLQGAVQGLTGSLESLGISFYQSIDNPLKDIVDKANGYIQQLMDAFENGGIQGLVSTLGNVLSDAITSIAQQAPAMIDLAVSLIQSFIQGISNNSSQLANSAISIVGALANGILNLLPQIIDLAVKLILALADGLTNHADQVVSGATKIISALVSALLQAAPQLATAAVKLAAAFFSELMKQSPPAGLFLGVVGAAKGLQGAFKGLDAAATGLDKLSKTGSVLDKLGGSFKSAKSNIEIIQVAASEAGDKFKAFGSKALDAGKAVAGSVTSLAQAAAGYAKLGLEAAASAVKLGIQKTATIASAAAQKMATAAQWLLNAALDANPISIIIIAVAALVAAFLVLWNTNEGFRNAIIGIWTAIVGFFSTVGSAIAGFFTEAWSAIQDAWGAVTGFFSGVWDGIVAVFLNVANWFGSVFSTAWDGIQTAWAAVVGFFQGIWDGIVTIFSAVVSFYSNIFRSAWSGIQAIWSVVVGFFQNIWDRIVAIFSAVVSFYGNIFKNAWNAIVSVWSVVTNWFGNVWSGIAAAFSGAASWFGNIFHSAWNAITSVFSAIGGWFGNRFNDAKKAITSIFNGNTLLDAGKQLLQGLWNGISNTMGWLKDRINSLGSMVVNAVKGVFGIHSPSHVFRDEIGKMLPPGIAVGFEKATPSAVKDMQTQMDGMVAKMQSTVSVQQSRAGAYAGTQYIPQGTIDNTASANSQNALLGSILDAIRNQGSDSNIILNVGETELGRATIKALQSLQRRTGQPLISL